MKSHSSELLPSALLLLLFILSMILTGCAGLRAGQALQPVQDVPESSNVPVLMWKGNTSGTGQYLNELTLTPTSVNVNTFGKVGEFTADGVLMGQPLYIPNLNMGSLGTHNVIIVGSENDSVFAIDADNPGGGPLWQRSFIDVDNGVTTLPDNFGGRTTLGGQVGITGTPVIDPTTDVLYFVTTDSNNGTAEQWLHSISILTGQDYGTGLVKIEASVPGTGLGSVNGQIAFNPGLQNQRMGLTELNGQIIVTWGSFSDFGSYHGWMMAFNAANLNLTAVFNSATTYQADDFFQGGGVGFWQGGAAPSIDASGNIFVEGANGSFNANLGGTNYGDTMLKMQLTGGTFQVMDWFTPADENCIDQNDLELGSGGAALIPTDFTSGNQYIVTISKEGRLYLLNQNNLGHYNAAGDTQIPEEFLVGTTSCSSSTTPAAADGVSWDRLYGNASYWNGYIYAAAANNPLRQFQFSGGMLNPNPTAESPTSYGYRGANTVISANGTQNGIVWVYEKQVSGGGVLHAYTANSVSTELWNSEMNSTRDALGEGIGFATPVITDGKVITTYDDRVGVFEVGTQP